MKEMQKRGNSMFNVKNPEDMIRVVLIVTVGILILAALLPVLINATIDMSTIPNLEFASFYAAGGVMQIVIGAAILLILFAIFLGRGKSKR